MSILFVYIDENVWSNILKVKKFDLEKEKQALHHGTDEEIVNSYVYKFQLSLINSNQVLTNSIRFLKKIYIFIFKPRKCDSNSPTPIVVFLSVTSKVVAFTSARIYPY